MHHNNITRRISLKENVMERKRIYQSYLFIVFICIMLVGCKSKDKVQIELEKIAKSINKECPIEYNRTIRLDSCSISANRTLKYEYTLLYTTSHFDSISFKENQKETILYGLQTNPDFRYFLDNQVIFVYSYTDEQGNERGSITITKDDYNKPAVKPTKSDDLGTDSKGRITESIANEIQQQLPIHFKESDLTITDCEAISDSTLQYKLMFNSDLYEKFDSIQFHKKMYPQIVASLKTDQSFSVILRNNISLRYTYLDKTGKYLYSIMITPKDYR